MKYDLTKTYKNLQWDFCGIFLKVKIQDIAISRFWELLRFWRILGFSISEIRDFESKIIDNSESEKFSKNNKDSTFVNTKDIWLVYPPENDHLISKS